MIQKFKPITSLVAPLLIDNIDTDQICAAEFLKITDKSGLGQQLFANWRTQPDFILNQKPYRATQILLAHKNFGCGSSREHAVWALKQYGFKVIIASSFADIFKSNALKNDLLAIELPLSVIDLMHQAVMTVPQSITIDLVQQQVIWNETKITFAIDAYSKNRIINDLDDISYTLTFNELITAYEKAHPSIGW
ncbi:MAG: hypothetical protein ACD_43C00218G0002 [uncultured bacterium]|nr:MAG: hypothetical protein ACD_43C00218G0002 [uncultured bacterium]